MDKLKPCPFCNRNPYPAPDLIDEELTDLGKQWVFYCQGCGAHGPSVSGEEQAIKAWNKRAKHK